MMKADDSPIAREPPSSLDQLRGAHYERGAITQRCAARLASYVRPSRIGGGGEIAVPPREAHAASVKLLQHNISRNLAE